MGAPDGAAPAAPPGAGEVTVGVVGVIANPMSGRDVRRLAARASSQTPESKRDQVARAVVGAVAGGARRVLVMREPLGISAGAVANLRLGAEIEVLEVGARLEPADTERAVAAMRKAGCGALVSLGGDGTQRVVARTWRGAPLVPLSTGTNNVFPLHVEATAAGCAAGLVAAGLAVGEGVARRSKCVRVEVEGEAPDLALVDAVLLEGDHAGSLLPFDPEHLRRLVLARAEPAACGPSAVGGLLDPLDDETDAGLEVQCAPPARAARRILAPLSPGLFRSTGVIAARRLALGEVVELRGPGLLAFDGDRARSLRPGQRARLAVVRDGPRVIDVAAALREGARVGALEDRSWRDALAEGPRGATCC